jgi:hypothetical protein
LPGWQQRRQTHPQIPLRKRRREDRNRLDQPPSNN